MPEEIFRTFALVTKPVENPGVTLGPVVSNGGQLSYKQIHNNLKCLMGLEVYLDDKCIWCIEFK